MRVGAGVRGGISWGGRDGVGVEGARGGGRRGKSQCKGGNEKVIGMWLATHALVLPSSPRAPPPLPLLP